MNIQLSINMRIFINTSKLRTWISAMGQVENALNCDHWKNSSFFNTTLYLTNLMTTVWWVVTISGFCNTYGSSSAFTDLELPYNTTFIRVLCRWFLSSVQLKCVEPVFEAIKVILTLQLTWENLQIETIIDLQNETIRYWYWHTAPKVYPNFFKEPLFNFTYQFIKSFWKQNKICWLL